MKLIMVLICMLMLTLSALHAQHNPHIILNIAVTVFLSLAMFVVIRR